MRTGDVGHGEPRDRRIQVQEGLVGDDGGDLSPEAGRLEILMYDETPARAPDRGQDRLAVPGHQGAQVDDLRGGLGTVRRRLAAFDHRAPGDHRDIAAFTYDPRLAEGQDVVVARVGAAR